MTRARVRGIPTRFQGTIFRSRLEARWAAFFSECSIPWTYEPPTDALCAGWLPDFLLGEQILVECKPALSVDKLTPACTKAERSGYKGQVLIVGLTPSCALSARLPGIWRPARWSKDVTLAWALAGNAVQWKKVRAPG